MTLSSLLSTSSCQHSLSCLHRDAWYSNCAASSILRTVAPKHHFEICSPQNPCWEDLVVSAYNNLNLSASFLGYTSRSESVDDWTFEGRHSPDNCGILDARLMYSSDVRFGNEPFFGIESFQGIGWTGSQTDLDNRSRILSHQLSLLIETRTVFLMKLRNNVRNSDMFSIYVMLGCRTM